MGAPEKGYETEGHEYVFVDPDGALHGAGAPISPLLLPDVVDVSSLPTTDPGVAGQVWVDGAAIKVSLGEV